MNPPKFGQSTGKTEIFENCISNAQGANYFLDRATPCGPSLANNCAMCENLMSPKPTLSCNYNIHCPYLYSISLVGECINILLKIGDSFVNHKAI